jgi:dihydropteroate synthase
MNSNTINVKGTLLSLQIPIVMGILNVTPDSFYAGSRKQTEATMDERIHTILAEGGRLIDVGGYSSRPGADDIPPEEEMRRLLPALRILSKHYSDAAYSVDTFRADIARRCVEDYGAAIINDIGGGTLDPDMFAAVARLKVPYILVHTAGAPQTMQQHAAYDNLIVDIRKYFADKVYELDLLGVNDIILDPGFGFGKTLDQNYLLLRRLEDFAFFGRPLLVGLSRKSMIYELLETTPADSLNGTTALHTLALMGGANILRAHDVGAAVETVRLTCKYMNSDDNLDNG